MAADKTKAQQTDTIVVKVANGKSVDLDGKLYGPGSKLTLPLSEAKSLYDMGFVVDADEEASAGTNAGGDSGPSVKAADPEQ